MDVIVWQKTREDYTAVFKLIEEALKTEQFSDGKEQFLVERLRKSEAFIPELSIVAERNKEIVGHILLTKIKIKSETGEFESLALVPVSVKPGFQKKELAGN